MDAVPADPVETNSRLGTYTNFVNLLDMCGIAVPAGTRNDGLPMSVTLLAGAGRDALTAGLARDIHAKTGGTLGATGWRPPAISKSDREADDGSIDLVVVGAHLSGMPLNGQLKALGARFCRAARTAPSYLLYALAGQAIPKPGLVRVSDDDGAKIDVEVWRLSPAAFGRFVADIPAPLGIGTINLEDGTSPKGFVVEQAGLADALDLTGYGGWRAYAEAGSGVA